MIILIIKDDTFKQPEKIPFLNSNSSSFVSFPFLLLESFNLSNIKNQCVKKYSEDKCKKDQKKEGIQEARIPKKGKLNFNMTKQEGTKNPETAWSKQTKVKVGKQKHGKWLRLDDQEKLHKNNITSQWLRIKLERNKGDEHTVGRKQVG